MRDGAGMVDLTAFAIFDITGPGALAGGAEGGDAADGRPRRAGRLHAGALAGRRLQGRPHDHAPRRRAFRVVTGGAHGPADRKWFSDHLPADGSAQLTDITSGWTTLGLWGPQARNILRRSPATTSRTRSSASAPAARSRWTRCACSRRASPTSATSAGSSTCRSSRACGCGTWSCEAGRPHGLVPVGIGVYGTTGRLEKCYRAYGFELESEYNVVEAGMAGPKVKDEDFVGRDAHLRQRDEDPAADPVHADRRRPHVDERRQALHARPRADPDPRRQPPGRPQGPRLLRDERRRRAVDRQAHPDGLPAARAGGRAASGSSSSTSASATRSRSPWPARRRSSTPRTRGSAARVTRAAEHPLLRQAGADDRRADRPRPPTSRRSRPATSASRSARTRSAASRRPCAWSRSTAAARPC